MRQQWRLKLAAFVVAWTAHLAQAVPADDPAPAAIRVTFTEESQAERTLTGRLVVEAVDGGIVVQGRDGRLWNITPDRLQSRETPAEPFAPYSHEELSAVLLQEFGPGFEIVTTRHYVICTNAGRHYGQWCGSLFERLMKAFQSHWTAAGFELAEPEFPLPAIVLADERQFTQFATPELGAQAANTKGYYSIPTNRIVLFDLTRDTARGPARSAEEITRRVEASAYNIATVVHEATHQIAFNTGMHRRYADNPLWLTEGMAMYFEMPDLRSRSGWRTIGRVHAARLRQFVEYARSGRRTAGALTALVASDDRFRDAATAGDAYAESWALTYFLIKTRKDDYVAYLKRIAAKPVLRWDEPQTRSTEFADAFGPWNELERDFIRYIQRLTR